MIFIKNGTINTITNGIIKGDILVENKKIKEETRYISWRIHEFLTYRNFSFYKYIVSQ